MINQARNHHDPTHSRDDHLHELIAACAKRNNRAFTLLYQSTSGKLLGVLRRILQREETVQDCLQEVYLKIWNNATDYKPGVAAPLTWMIAIARHQAIDHLRRLGHEVTEADAGGLPEQIDLLGSPEERAAENAEEKRLSHCFYQLKQEQRQVMALAYFRGLTHNELAKQAILPAGTVKSWIRRSLVQLRRCLEA